jgi:hypothetical protein
MRRLRRTRSLLALLALLTVFSSAGVAFGGSTASAATCYGAGCTGVDPNTSGCASGAYDLDDIMYVGVRVELRYSSACNAVWTRLTNTDSCSVSPQYRLPLAQIRAYNTSSAPASALVFSRSAAPSGCGNGYVWWSPMAGSFSAYWFRACEAYPADGTPFNCTSPH